MTLRERLNQVGRPASRPRRLACLAITAVASVVLAGCGGSGTSGGSATSTRSTTVSAVRETTSAPKCGAGTGKPATATPIPVGAMDTQSNGVSTSEGPASAAAYFACLNANGGIDGHPIQYTIEDDGLDPATAARSALTLASDKKVVAIVGSAAYVECPVAGPIYAKASIDEIEAAGGSAQCFTAPNISSVSQGGTLSVSLTVQDEIAHGAKRIAVLAPNIPGLGAAFVAAANRTAAANGGRLVKSVLYKPGITDATSVVLDAMSANPQGIVFAGLKQDGVAVLKAAQTQNLKGRVVVSSAAPLYAPDVPQAIAGYWDGALRVAHQFSAFNATGPDTTLWHEVMNKYATGVAQDEFSEGSFLAAKIFSDTLAKLKGPINRTTVGEAIRSIRNYTTDMLCGGWSFGTGAFHVSNTAGRIAELSGDSWKDVQGCTEIRDPILSPPK